MLLRFIEISDKIGLILLQHPTAPTILITLEFQIIKDTNLYNWNHSNQQQLYFLENYMLWQSSYTLLHTLKNQLESCEPISKEECHLKERLTKEFQNRLKNIEQKSLITIATILDPRFKIHFLDKVVCN